METERHLALRVLMMPKDTNAHGTIFGGVVLAYIDQAALAGVWDFFARRGMPDCLVVTVAMDRIEFLEPVYVGDVVSLYSSIVRVGRTSLRIRVEVETMREGKTVRLTEAEVTYVAVSDEGGKRHPIPLNIKPLSDSAE